MFSNLYTWLQVVFEGTVMVLPILGFSSSGNLGWETPIPYCTRSSPLSPDLPRISPRSWAFVPACKPQRAVGNGKSLGPCSYRTPCDLALSLPPFLKPAQPPDQLCCGLPCPPPVTHPVILQWVAEGTARGSGMREGAGIAGAVEVRTLWAGKRALGVGAGCPKPCAAPRGWGGERGIKPSRESFLRALSQRAWAAGQRQGGREWGGDRL